MNKIKETLKNGRSTKTIERSPGIGRHEPFALKHAHDSVTTNMEKVVRDWETFYAKLYSDQAGQEDGDGKIFLWTWKFLMQPWTKGKKALKERVEKMA